MASCPNKSHPEWKVMVQHLGERDAYRAYIANGEQLLSMAQTVRVTAALRNTHYHISDLVDKLRLDNQAIRKPDNSVENDTYKRGGLSLNRLTASVLPIFYNRPTKDGSQDTSPGEIKARYWWDNNRVDPNDKLSVLGGTPLNRAEFGKRWNMMVEQAKTKGTILHMMIERELTPDQNRRLEITQEIADLGAKMNIMNPESDFQWIKSDDNLKDMFEVLGINVLSEKDEKKKDQLLTEHSVMSELLGYGATIDMLVAHANKLFSIIELKTGKHFDDRYTKRIMKYGEQALHITDNPREQAKLQVMLQAFALKVENPEMQFRNLKVHWVPDAARAKQEDFASDVNVSVYLKMVEQYYRTEQKETYEKIIAKSPKAFDATEYHAAGASLAQEVAEDKRSIDQIIADYRTRLRVLRNSGDPKFAQEEIRDITKKLLELTTDANTDLTLTEDMDLGMIKTWIGNSGDVHNPFLQAFGKLYSERSHEMETDFQKRFMTFQALVKDVKNEYMDSHAVGMVDKVTGGQINFLNVIPVTTGSYIRMMPQATNETGGL